MLVFTRIATALVIIGGINWGLIGAFNFNLVEAIFGADSVATRIVYVLVGISALIALLNFSPNLYRNTGAVRRENEVDHR